MNYKYQQDNLMLCVLSEQSAERVLAFYSNNKDIFDSYETDKPDNFYTLQFQKNLLRAENEAFLRGTHVRFFLFDCNIPNKIIGTISFFDIKRGAFFSCNTGYKIDCAYHNQRYGYRMLSMAIDIIVREYDMHRIEAYIFPSNQSSIALVQKLGFVSEGTATAYVRMHDEWVDHLRYVYIS